MTGDPLTTPWGELAVVPASRDDALAILQLRDDLAAWMCEHRIDQWHPGEMPLAWIEECISQGWIYTVSRDSKVMASVTLTWADPFVWGEESDAAGYIHMLMVDRGYAAHGIGRSLLNWAERQSARAGCHLARLDCVRSNGGLRAYYERAGYRLVGYRDFSTSQSLALGGTAPSDSETALYEKTLSGGCPPVR